MNFPTVALVDKLLGLCRRGLSATLVRRVDRLMVLVGGYGIYALIAMLVILLVTIAIRIGDISFVLFAVGVVPAGLVFQYVAVKMLDAVERLVGSSRTELASAGFLDVASLVGVVLAVLAPIGGIISAVQFGSFAALFSGLATGLLSAYFAAIALNHTLINVHVSTGATIGQEAIGVITFFLKALYKLTPIAFGAGVVVQTVIGIDGLIGVLSGSFFGLNALSLLLAPFAVMLLPLIAYVVFISAYLLLDVWRAILAAGQVADRYRQPTAEPAAGAAPPQAAPRPVPAGDSPQIGGQWPGAPQPAGPPAPGAAPARSAQPRPAGPPQRPPAPGQPPANPQGHRPPAPGQPGPGQPGPHGQGPQGQGPQGQGPQGPAPYPPRTPYPPR